MTVARILTLLSLESRHASQNRLQGIEIDVDAGLPSQKSRPTSTVWAYFQREMAQEPQACAGKHIVAGNGLVEPV